MIQMPWAKSSSTKFPVCYTDQNTCLKYWDYREPDNIGSSKHCLLFNPSFLYDNHITQSLHHTVREYSLSSHFEYLCGIVNFTSPLLWRDLESWKLPALLNSLLGRGFTVSSAQDPIRPLNEPYSQPKIQSRFVSLHAVNIHLNIFLQLLATLVTSIIGDSFWWRQIRNNPKILLWSFLVIWTSVLRIFMGWYWLPLPSAPLKDYLQRYSLSLLSWCWLFIASSLWNFISQIYPMLSSVTVKYKNASDCKPISPQHKPNLILPGRGYLAK